MMISKESEQNLQIRKLKRIRLILIIIAVLLALSIGVVYAGYIRNPEEIEEESERRGGSFGGEEQLRENEDSDEEPSDTEDSDAEKIDPNEFGTEELNGDDPTTKAPPAEPKGDSEDNSQNENEIPQQTPQVNPNEPSQTNPNVPPQTNPNVPPQTKPKDDSTVKEEEDPPVKEETEPKEEENPPVKEETEPKEEEDPPVKEETEPKEEEDPPVKEETEPKEEETPSKEEETPPKAEETQPKTEETQPKTEETQPKTEETEPKVEETQPEEAEEQDVKTETTGAEEGPLAEGDNAAEDSSMEIKDSENIRESDDAEQKSTAEIICLILCGLLGMDLIAIIGLSIVIAGKQKDQGIHLEEYEKTCMNVENPVVGYSLNGQASNEGYPYNLNISMESLHHIGARPYQEDSLGAMRLNDGCLAIVADGMGGLSAGDKVSQKIVGTMLGYGKQLQNGQMDGVLEQMVSGVNREVNHMLGEDGIYKSGSTLLAVLVRNNRFHWITVGDSRIYFYRNGNLTQLNQEHNVGQDLLIKAGRGEISYREAKSAPKKNRVTSFIGMGNLRYIDRSIQSIALEPGDRILLMTDGVFNALPDQTIASVLMQCADIKHAAAEMERLVIQKGSPRQDNFTAIILGF